MLRSMTGFGKAAIELPEKNITIEIKSLNSKQLDINARMPGLYREKELGIRNLLAQELGRGKVDFSMQYESTGQESNYSLNMNLAQRYYEDLKELQTVVGQQEKTDYLALIMRMPDVLKPEKEELNAEEWQLISDGIKKALVQINDFRETEGRGMATDIRSRIELIMKLLQSVEEYEQSRAKVIRERIKGNLMELQQEGDFDTNRFEQELIYYLEKLDITEEKVRLKNHCEYFLNTMDQGGIIGKKLGFISQEIGREINTLGSKANHAEIQKIVVSMKDELEKIKEQLMNVL